MARCSLDGVTRRFGPVTAVDRVDLEVGDGEILAILGASGCGKTTLLRAIAGLEPIDAGTIRLDGEPLSAPDRHVAPEDRRIGMVFQSYALWPHMSVADNVGYPLRVRQAPAAERARETASALAAVGLTGLEARRPHELSGGQQQRVALARCLTQKARLVLMDEPLANLDMHLREKVLDELHAFHRAARPTLIYITHDQTEALGFADRVAVMAQGRIHQVDTPAQLYARPASRTVAAFLGQSALVPGRVEAVHGLSATVRLDGGLGVVRADAAEPPVIDALVTLCVRPEDVRVGGPDAEANGSDPARPQAMVERASFQGGRHALMLDVAGIRLRAHAHDRPAVGAMVPITIERGWIVPQA